ncbi:MAG TPA: hypothetical protein VFU86_20010 [Terriglobales bacterium]|nr:hypothetical protein [Terriglobales bacterium]
MPAQIKIVNLEEDLPTVNRMRLKLDRALAIARSEGTTLLKLIHGYGSSGVGGALRIAVHSSLLRYKDSGLIRDFIDGENFRVSDETTWTLLKRMPEIKQDRDLGRGNKGITIVLM